MTADQRNGTRSANDILLIHGAWQGSWVWDEIVPLLSEGGWCVHTVELPGVEEQNSSGVPISLDLYVRLCEDIISEIDGKIVVVGHSGGGIVASQLAERLTERVACVIYVAGIMLQSGGTFVEVVQSLASLGPYVDGIEPHLEWTDSKSISRVPTQAAIDYFLHDVPPERAGSIAARLTPQHEHGRAMSPELTAARFGTVPRIYIEAALDRSVVPAAQRLMQERQPGASRFSMQTGHAPHVVDPIGFVTLLERALGEARLI